VNHILSTNVYDNPASLIRARLWPFFQNARLVSPSTSARVKNRFAFQRALEAFVFFDISRPPLMRAYILWKSALREAYFGAFSGGSFTALPRPRRG
jgi:hypothetical protein